MTPTAIPSARLTSRRDEKNRFTNVNLFFHYLCLFISYNQVCYAAEDKCRDGGDLEYHAVEQQCRRLECYVKSLGNNKPRKKEKFENKEQQEIILSALFGGYRQDDSAENGQDIQIPYSVYRNRRYHRSAAYPLRRKTDPAEAKQCGISPPLALFTGFHSNSLLSLDCKYIIACSSSRFSQCVFTISKKCSIITIKSAGSRS